MSKDNLYRILTPSEFVVMKDAPLPSHFKVSSQTRNLWLDTLLFTGMRYEELLYLDGHWEQFDAKNNAISLPKAYTKTNMDRTVHLTPAYSKTLAQYLREFGTLELPPRNSMNLNLKRWWIYKCECGHIFHAVGLVVCPQCKKRLNTYDMWYPTAKTFRKSWESWLLFADYPLIKVARSQGHTVAVCEHYYANLPPTLKSEVEAVKKLTEGWMT